MKEAIGMVGWGFIGIAIIGIICLALEVAENVGRILFFPHTMTTHERTRQKLRQKSRNSFWLIVILVPAGIGTFVIVITRTFF